MKYSLTRGKYILSRRDVIERVEGYHLREEAAFYKALFETEKDDIGPENAYLWDVNIE